MMGSRKKKTVHFVHHVRPLGLPISDHITDSHQQAHRVTQHINQQRKSLCFIELARNRRIENEGAEHQK